MNSRSDEVSESVREHMRKWHQENLLKHPESKVFREGLLKHGGPDSMYSPAWDICYPPKWHMGNNSFDTKEEALLWAENEIKDAVEKRPDWAPFWVCEKCGKSNHSHDNGAVRYLPAKPYDPRYEKQGPGSEELYSHYTTRGYFSRYDHSDKLVWMCQCGNHHTTKTKEQTNVS